ncbi:DUF952 domain-containing protein [Brevundimonas sp.]|uniref:DUF952 domain-containing protein n=1 Tax=Brevundimonas sp. TaxID=1871086 RepID=UPI002FCC43A4
MTATAYKLVDRSEWEAARAAGAYAGSAVDHADGYIHMSTAAQLAETARRHYAGRDGLVLVAVDTAALGDALRWEPSRGGDLFPHLYGALPVSAALSERALSVQTDGTPAFDDGGRTWA